MGSSLYPTSNLQPMFTLSELATQCLPHILYPIPVIQEVFHGSSTIPGPLWMPGIRPFNFFECLFHWPWIVYTHICANQYSVEYSRSLLFFLCGVLLCSAKYSNVFLLRLATLFPQLRVSTRLHLISSLSQGPDILRGHKLGRS